jgi:hypothetical protein
LELTQTRASILYYASLAFTLTVFILSPLLFLGLDVTDVGYHLTHQQMANAMGLQYAPLIPLWWFSDILGGWWLQLTQPLGLVGARLGAVLLYGVCAVITQLLLSRLAPPSPRHLWGVLLAVMITAKPLATGTLMILDYYTIPMFFGLLAVSIAILDAERPSIGKALLLGLIIGFTTLARATMGLLLLLPLVKQGWRSWAVTLGACTCVVAGMLLLFIQQGILDDYLLSLHNDEGHSYNVRYYLAQMVAVGGLLLLLAAVRFWGSDNAVLFTLILILSLYFLPSEISITHPKILHKLFRAAWKAMHNTHILFVGAILGLILWRTRYAHYGFYTLLFALAIGLGSDTGLSKLSYGFWLLAGMAALAAQSAFKQRVLAIITAFSFLALYTPIYRDSLTRPLGIVDQGFLRGVITSQKRKVSFEELLRVVSQETHANDRIMAYPAIPMVYIASDRRPITESPWLEGHSQSSIARQLKVAAAGPRPVLFVRAKAVTYDPRWANTGPKEHIADIQAKAAFIDQWTQNEYAPKLIWNNAEFEVWR